LRMIGVESSESVAGAVLFCAKTFAENAKKVKIRKNLKKTADRIATLLRALILSEMS
jgi:hypothetical protein